MPEQEPRIRGLKLLHCIDGRKSCLRDLIPPLAGLYLAHVEVEIFGPRLYGPLRKLQKLRQLQKRMRRKSMRNFKAKSVELLAGHYWITNNPAFLRAAIRLGCGFI